MEACVTAAHDLDDVVEHGAGSGGDDANAAGEGRQWTLAGGVEEAFCEQAGFELLIRELECARAAGFERLGDELEMAAGLVYGDAAAREDSEAVLWAEAEEQSLAAEEHDGKLGLAVLQREINVAGGRGTAVRNLAFDPDVLVLAFELLADAGDQVADGPDAAFLGPRRRGRSRLSGESSAASWLGLPGCGICRAGGLGGLAPAARG